MAAACISKWLFGWLERGDEAMNLNAMDENRDCHQSIGMECLHALHGNGGLDVQGYALVNCLVVNFFQRSF